MKMQKRMNKRGMGPNKRSQGPNNAVGEYFGDAWSLAKRTANGLNEIRKLINVEHKYVDVNGTSSSTFNGTVTHLSPIAQGDNVSERDGDSIKVQSFHISGAVFRNTLAAATVNESVRIIVVRALQDNLSPPSTGEILETAGTATAPYQGIDFLNSSDLNKKFGIVYDDLFSLDNAHQVRLVNFTTNHDCHVYYRGVASNQTGNGNYYLLVVSNTNATVPSFDFSSRLRFTDN